MIGKWIGRHALYLAWVVSVASLLGSLYYSEIKYLEPCHLCWYQRICVYPLAIILGIAAYRRDNQIIIYALPLAAMGAILAVVHILEQTVPGLSPVKLCGSGPSCSVDVLNYFGFLTMPMMSLFNFLLIGFFLILSAVKK